MSERSRLTMTSTERRIFIEDSVGEGQRNGKWKMGISIMLYTANDLPILCYAVLRWAVSSVGSERLVYTQ